MPAKIIDFTAPHKRKTESEIEISKIEKMALDKKTMAVQLCRLSPAEHSIKR